MSEFLTCELNQNKQLSDKRKGSFDSYIELTRVLLDRYTSRFLTQPIHNSGSKILQVSKSLSKNYNMLPQRNVVLKDALCAMLHDIDYVALKIGVKNRLGNITFKQSRHKFNIVLIHVEHG